MGEGEIVIILDKSTEIERRGRGERYRIERVGQRLRDGDGVRDTG